MSFLSFVLIFSVSIAFPAAQPAQADACDPYAIVTRITYGTGEVVGTDPNTSNYYWSEPDISADGRYVVFASYRTDLVANDTNNTRDIFRYDRLTCVLDRVSLGNNSVELNRDAGDGYISDDGRYVTFATNASNLDPIHTNYSLQVYVRDLQTGQTMLLKTSGGALPNGDGWPADISADGSRILLNSTARNLAPFDTNPSQDVFVYDRTANTYTMLTLNLAGNGSVWGAGGAFARDVDRVTFGTDGIVVPNDLNGFYDTFIRDLTTAQTLPVTNPVLANQSNGHSSVYSDISADGRYVAFMSTASNLVSDDTNGTTDVFVRDMTLSAFERVSVGPGGIQSNGLNGFGSIPSLSLSHDGRFVSFNSDATNLVTGDTNGWQDVFVRDRQTATTYRVNLAADGTPANFRSHNSELSENGRFVVFASDANNLVPGDDNNLRDWFLVDWQRLHGLIPPTPTPTLIAPIGTSSETQPTFSWNQVEGAAWYYLWITGDNGHVLDQWYDGWYLCSNGVCSVTPPLTLSSAGYTWWVRAWSESSGYSVWSAPANFVVPGAPPVAPTLVAPLNVPANPQPTFSWNQVQGVTWYYLWVNGPDGYVMDQWYDGWNLCTAGVCSVTPALNLPSGWYTWWVQGWSPSGGYGAWSDAGLFTVAPATPLIIAPTGTITTPQPAFSWYVAPGADWYYLWIAGDSGHVLDQWYDATAYCAGNTCSITPPLNLPAGDYQWWVLAFDNAGSYGTWSSGTPFTIAMPLPEAPAPDVVLPPVEPAPELPQFTPEISESPSGG
ncbi:MAG: hypothetical protein IAE80_04565 [Anaerolinea sp.]|nr:hypothetical protein [Anaerolinea sp.]